MTDPADLLAVERVRCLDCGITYLKPCGGGTSRRDPGCPRCGYLGWIAATVPVSETARRHFAGDQLRRPQDQLR